MEKLRKDLEKRLHQVADITVAPWKDTDLICVSFRGKEVGHFHGVNVLDLRLSPKIIREEGLSREVSAECHPKRSQNSRWICIRFESVVEVDRLMGLIERACGERV